MLAGAMKWSARQMLTLFLAVFVTLGVSGAVAHANSMAANMATASSMDMGGSGHDGCSACPKGGDHGSNATTCSPICVAPVLAMLPQGSTPLPIQAASAFTILQLSFFGRTSPPEPYPPRPLDLA
jgi:hypothetical protein